MGSKLSNILRLENDVPPLTDHERDLVVSCIPLAYQFAGQRINLLRIDPLGLRADEIRGSALAGLVRAARKYIPARGQFNTYAGYWILAQMQDDNLRQPRLPLFADMGGCPVVAGDDMPEQMAAAELLEVALAVVASFHLPPRRKEYVEFYLRHPDCTLLEIGSVFRVSAEAVRQNLALVLPRLRAELVRRGVQE